jgi:glycosyl transferase, family 25
VLQSALAHRRHWNLLRLSTVNSGKWWPVRRLGATHLAVCLTREKGAGGYVVDRLAARKMVDRLLPMRLAWDIAFDLEWLIGFKALGIHPMVIEQNTGGFETQIQSDLARIKIRSKLKYLTVGPFRLLTESSRLLYRLYRLLALKLLLRA